MFDFYVLFITINFIIFTIKCTDTGEKLCSVGSNFNYKWYNPNGTNNINCELIDYSITVTLITFVSCFL
jgi:hypothetical protein